MAADEELEGGAPEFDESQIRKVFETKAEIEAGHIRVKAWMLARALSLDFLIKQVNLSEMADHSSLEKQVGNLTQILSLLDEDKTTTSKWSALLNKTTLQQSKSALREYLPQLQALVAANPETVDADAAKIVGDLREPLEALGQVAQKLASGR